MSEAFWNGLWAGIFELCALGFVAGWVNLVYQRIRSRQDLRRDLIDEIDAFSTDLYKPRKIYQYILQEQNKKQEGRDRASPVIDHPHQLSCLEAFTDAAGRFRAIQVKLVPLFGFDIELFAHYLAVWQAVREVRKRMERGEDLYAEHENSSSSDALYRLLDQFRYRAQVTPSIQHKPSLLSAPEGVEEQIKTRADEIYQHYLHS
jgi:hypothetical protein